MQDGNVSYTSIASSPAASGYAASLGPQILNTLTGRLPAVVPTLLYRLSLVVVAGAMVLLVLIYVALVAAVIYGMWAYASEVELELKGLDKSGLFFALAVYVMPYFFGSVFVLFLVKPLFTPRPRAVHPLELDRRREPLLYAFIDRLCQVVGAPTPSAIYMDVQVNAAVAPHRERGQELTLTLGAPLVAGLSLSQLAGVLAHEFGHFKQRAGLRASFFIRKVNLWLARVTYERDAIDDWLIRQSKDPENTLAVLLFWACRGMIWLTRKFLAVLVWLGSAISSFQMRQMEIDADRYEVHLVGYPVFASTVEEMQVLNVAHQKTLAGLEECWNDGRLPESLSNLTLAHRGSLDDKLMQMIRQHIAEEKTGLFSSHPADRDRLAMARAQKASPILDSDQPATALFRDFDALSRFVTRIHYCSVLGEAIRPEQLMTVERAVDQLETSSQEREALSRYFQTGLTSLRPLALGGIAPNPTVMELVDARLATWRSRSELEEKLETYGEAFSTLLRARQGEVLCELRLPFDAKELGMPGRDLATLRSVKGQSTVKLDYLERGLGGIEAQLGNRLGTALGLLALPEMAQKVDPEESIRAEVPVLLELTILMGSLFKTCRELMVERAVFGALASRLDDNEDNDELKAKIVESMRRIEQHIGFLGTMLGEVAYPFEHRYEAMTMAQYLGAADIGAADGEPGGSLSMGELFDASHHVLDRFFDVYFRAAGRLAAVAQRLEEAAGLQPLADPDS